MSVDVEFAIFYLTFINFEFLSANTPDPPPPRPPSPAGRGVGSLLGGFLIGAMCIRNTFRLMAVVCAVTCVAYFVNRVLFAADQRARAEEREKEEEMSGKKEGLKSIHIGNKKRVETGDFRDDNPALVLDESTDLVANGKENKIM